MMDKTVTVNNALLNPNVALAALDKFESEKSLLNFMRCSWHTLEPEAPFVENFCVHAICDHLEAVTNGEITRLLINVPPGFTKSLTTNVFWPAFEWGPKEMASYRYISFSHEQTLAIRDLVRCRNLINSEWYQEKWGHLFTWKSDQNAKLYYENSRTGWRQACASDSMVGRRGDRVIGDDPHTVKGAESDAVRESVLQTFAETIPSRLNKQGESAIIVIMQRVHEKDVSGFIISGELGYEHLMLPMEYEKSRCCYTSIKPSYIKKSKKKKVFFDKVNNSWTPNYIADASVDYKYKIDIRTKENELLDPIRFTKKSIDALKEVFRLWGGTYAEVSQLQQRPAPRGGGLFKKDDFQFIDCVSELGTITSTVVRGWDLAASVKKNSAYTVGVKMAKVKDSVVILDVARFRKSPAIVENTIKNIVTKDGISVRQDFPQDPGQAGKIQKSSIASLLQGYITYFSPETGDKTQRCYPFAAQVEAGNVYLLKANWNDAYISEAISFPNSTFKDQIDASSRAYSCLINKNRKAVITPPTLVLVK